MGQSDGERNYHIFYQVMVSKYPAQKGALLSGLKVEDMHVLNQSQCYTLTVMSDEKFHAEVKEAMDKLVEKLEEDMRRIAKGGGDDAIKRAVKRGKLLVRDRINQLLDPGKLERSNRIELTRREPSLTLSLPPSSPPPEQVPRFSSSACTLARAFTAATWSPAAAS